MDWKGFQRALASGISGVATPPLLAAAAFALVIYSPDGPAAHAGRLLGICLVFAVVLPTAYVWVLLARGAIDGFFIPDRAGRLHPLLVSAASCLAGLILLRRASAPPQVQALMLCYAVTGVLAAACTLRWKISLHAVGAWMPVGALVFLFGLSGLVLAPVPIAVSWARVALGTHTPVQVLAGGMLALFSTWLLFGPVLNVPSIP